MTSKTLQRDIIFSRHLGPQIARAMLSGSSVEASLQKGINHFGMVATNSGLSSADVEWQVSNKWISRVTPHRLHEV